MKLPISPTGLLYGPFVYRLGHQVFNLKRGVQFPYGLPPSSEKRISMKRKTNTLRPRNGYVALMRLRKSGAHLKSRKAERRAETVALKRMDRDVPGRANPSPSAPGARCGSGGTADAGVSNTLVARRAGSSPATRTRKHDQLPAGLAKRQTQRS